MIAITRMFLYVKIASVSIVEEPKRRKVKTEYADIPEFTALV